MLERRAGLLASSPIFDENIFVYTRPSNRLSARWSLGKRRFWESRRETRSFTCDTNCMMNITVTSAWTFRWQAKIYNLVLNNSTQAKSESVEVETVVPESWRWCPAPNVRGRRRIPTGLCLLGVSSTEPRGAPPSSVECITRIVINETWSRIIWWKLLMMQNWDSLRRYPQNYW